MIGDRLCHRSASLEEIEGIYNTISFSLPSLTKLAERKIQYSVFLKTIQEFSESRTVLSWGDEGGFFVTVTVDLKEVLGRKGCSIDFLAELKRDNGILSAMDDQNGGVAFP